MSGRNRDDPYYLPLEPQSEAGKAIKGGGAANAGTHPWDDDPPEPIPMPPKRSLDPPEREALALPNRVRGGISDRARAATNLKVDGFSYQEIADMLEYKNAGEAKKEVERTLAMTHPVDDYETLRMLATSRAEERLKLSSQMAGAHFLVTTDEDGNEVRVANEKQLAWATLAATDLMNWATITGAKAPTKMEITPDLAAMDALVDRIARAAGHEEVMDAEVIDMDVLDDPLEIEARYDDEP